MTRLFTRRVARWFAPFILLALHAPAIAAANQSEPPVATTPAGTDWLYAGSDIPRDPAWVFGTLPNGVRYAVRRNGVPPGQVAIRVRMDVGSLFERDDERGYAHLVEHLAFRGSEHVADGEARRIWQRFGITFGSDSNAQTTPTHTAYQLDMPSATAVTLDEGLKLLAGMIRAPRISRQSLDAERAVVMAELREADGPQRRLSDAINAHIFAGQPLAKRSPIGTVESLTAANVDRVADFHRRWYRPERAVVVIVGDGSTTDFAALVAKHFGGWRGAGIGGDTPPFGDPDPAQPATVLLSEANQARTLTLALMRPWRHQIDTVAYTRQLYLNHLAIALVNRRLERSARRGGMVLVANAEQQVVSRSTDATVVQIVPAGDNWQGALAEVRGVIADAVTTAPSQADIDRESNDVATVLGEAFENRSNEPGARLADDMVQAVDIGETLASPEAQLSMFAAIRASATPAVMLATTQAIFRAPVTRLAMVSPNDSIGSDAALAAALDAPVVPVARSSAAQAVAMTDLPLLGKPGTIVETAVVQGLQGQRLTLSNGVTILMSRNTVEPDKVRLNVRFGRGASGIAPGAPSLLWTGDYALAASGVGSLGQDALDELTNGRQIQLNFAVEDDAFEWSAETRPADLADQLRLIAVKLAHPGWDTAPVERLKLGLLTGYDQQDTTPSNLIERDLNGWLRGGDDRFRSPTRAEIAALTPASFRAFWEPLLRSGPIEVQIFGDFGSLDIEKLLTETVGTLAPNVDPGPPPGARVKFPAHTTSPQIVFHRGDAGQAAALIAWPTGGGIANVRTGRQIEVLAAIVNDRLFERLRAQDGATYGPIVSSDWPTGFDHGGYLLVGSLLARKDVDRFFDTAGAIARELASAPVSADELARAVGPMKEQLARQLTGNLFWMHLLEGATRDPRFVRSALTIERDVAQVTPDDIQRLARQYLIDSKRWSVVILPQGQTLADTRLGAAANNR